MVRLLAVVMSAVILVGSFAEVTAAGGYYKETAQEADRYYKETVQAAYIGDIPEGEMTRGQALLMLYCTFGDLPTPKGNNQRLKDTEVSFSDIPPDKSRDSHKQRGWQAAPGGNHNPGGNG